MLHEAPRRLDSPSVAVRLHALVRLFRPLQWIKNVLVFAALLYSGQLLQPDPTVAVLVAFAGYCLASSAVYCFNDALDAEKDRMHPKKRSRPVAAGLLSRTEALGAALLLAGAGMWLGLVVAPGLAWILGIYLVLNVLYSTWLKQIVLVDIFVVAAGFVLRAVGGAVAVSVQPSVWFLACVLLLSLFLATAKRRHEVTLLGDRVSGHRGVLAEYPLPLLDQIISVLGSSMVMTYMLYTMEAGKQPWLMATSPFVLFALFRYLYLIHRRSEGGSAEEMLVTDMPLLITVILWALATVAILYLVPATGPV